MLKSNLLTLLRTVSNMRFPGLASWPRRDQPFFSPRWAAAFLIATALGSTTTSAKNQEMVLNSTPQGARIEFKGNSIGTTPYTAVYPMNYFNGPRTLFSKRLGEQVVVTLYKDGYQPKTVELTHGPFQWRSLDGTNTFYYRRGDV